MRTIVWILGTLLNRSWLIAAGVLLGLLARQYLAPTTPAGDAQIVDAKAKAYYDRVIESNSTEPVSQK